MIPVWVYFVVSGILFSAYMSIKTGNEDRKLEFQAIEREGEIYMKRLEQEKEQRNQNEPMTES
jgi:hypothetical protein